MYLPPRVYCRQRPAKQDPALLFAGVRGRLGAPTVQLAYNIPDEGERKAFSLEKSGKPAAAGCPVKAVQGRELPHCRLTGCLPLAVSREMMLQGTAGRLAVNTFISQLPLDPAPAKGAKPHPAFDPLAGKGFVIQISIAPQSCQDRFDQGISASSVTQPLRHFLLAPGAQCKGPVCGIPGPRKVLLTVFPGRGSLLRGLHAYFSPKRSISKSPLDGGLYSFASPEGDGVAL